VAFSKGHSKSLPDATFPVITSVHLMSCSFFLGGTPSIRPAKILHPAEMWPFAKIDRLARMSSFVVIESPYDDASGSLQPPASKVAAKLYVVSFDRDANISTTCYFHITV
jgi:hypothetical protein